MISAQDKLNQKSVEISKAVYNYDIGFKIVNFLSDNINRNIRPIKNFLDDFLEEELT